VNTTQATNVIIEYGGFEDQVSESKVQEASDFLSDTYGVDNWEAAFGAGWKITGIIADGMLIEKYKSGVKK
jgi:hypothetical protein